MVIFHEQTKNVLSNDNVENKERNSTDHGCEPSQKVRRVAHAPDENDLVIANEERSDDFLQTAEKHPTKIEDNDDVHEDHILYEQSDADMRRIGASDFVKVWKQRSKLYVLQPALVNKAWSKKEPPGLMMLLFCKYMFNAIRDWTAPVMRGKEDSKGLTMNDLYKYVGMEIVASLLRVGSLKDIWSEILFFQKMPFIL